MTDEELALIVGEIKAKVEQLGTDVSTSTARIEALEMRRDWSQDDISNLYRELADVKEQVETLETPVVVEEPAKETQLDNSTVQETPKKKRRWGILD